MKVLLLTKVGEELDEGMKKFGMELADSIAGHADVEVETFDTTNPFDKSNLKKLITYNPDIIHLVVGPTNKSLTFLKVASLLTGAKSVSTCIHPDISYHIKSIYPDLVYVQTPDHAAIFSENSTISYLPVGIDTDRFSPSLGEGSEIRDRFGLSDQPIFLHVGHIKHGRKVQNLSELTQYGEVLIIGSPSTNPNEELETKLRKQGCTVCTEYISDIERIYNTADIYVFPAVADGHSILMPLSVLEAMACNLPVLTAPFGALPTFFEEGNGLTYVSNIKSICKEDVEQVQTDVQNRERIQRMSWDEIGRTVVEDYKTL